MGNSQTKWQGAKFGPILGHENWGRTCGNYGAKLGHITKNAPKHFNRRSRILLSATGPRSFAEQIVWFNEVVKQTSESRCKKDYQGKARYLKTMRRKWGN